MNVYLQALCWDTDPDLGENTPDRPFIGVTVAISGPTPKTKPTDGSGIATFEALTPGQYSVVVSKPGFDDATNDIAIVDPATAEQAQQDPEVEIHQTAHSIRIMRRSAANPPGPDGKLAPPPPYPPECKRKHVHRPGGAPGEPTIWLPVFWFPWSEPWLLLWIRDPLWLASLAGVVAGAVVGNPALAALSAAFLGYFSGVIFGFGLGLALIIVAFAVFGVVLVMAMGASFLPLPAPDPWFFPAVCGVWAGFLLAVALGRRDKFSKGDWLVVIIAAIAGMAAAIVALVIMHPPVGVAIASAGISLVTVFAASLLGHVFMNDGKTNTTLWGDNDFLLPYEGERYCVQGLRGWISHFGWQEFCYDWSIPEGTPFLCSKEGHIVEMREDRDGTQFWSGNSTANFVNVRHKDGSIAEYLHLKQNGITEVNPAVAGLAEIAANPVHVYPGQQLAATGNVGISMFSHLHFTVKHRPGLPDNGGDTAGYLPVRFQDPDTASHDNRCYSMRKYRSSNLNRGTIRVADTYPVFNPGGAPTNGEQKPGGGTAP